MLSSMVAAFGSIVIGGTVAAITIVGVVESQTAAPEESPVSVSSSADELVTYGSN